MRGRNRWADCTTCTRTPSTSATTPSWSRRYELRTIVSPEWLHEQVHDPDLRVVDFRWSLLGGSGHDAYARGHIPGAVFVELDAVTGRSGGGRHPLPTGAQFEDEMRKAGISSNTRVVVYDDSGGSVASRLWFLLRWFGHDAQAVLDGGLGAWGGGLEGDQPDVAR